MPGIRSQEERLMSVFNHPEPSRLDHGAGSVERLFSSLQQVPFSKLVLTLITASFFLLPSAAQGTEITDVSWDAELEAIHIELDSWPTNWGGWTMYLDGDQIDMEGDEGNPIIRPDAPLEQSPTGLLVCLSGDQFWIAQH